jgi:DNA/RNA-binding domain of Phe-tRNA-synthetase-like protein
MNASDRGPKLKIAADLRDRLRVGVVGAAPVRVGPSDERLKARLRQTEEDMRLEFAGLTPAEIPPLRAARELYRGFGIDPTKTRPSSEALLRRVLKGRPLPEIVNAVDLCNLLAVRFLLPIGLYDAAKIAGDVELRRGRPGESYAGIRKSEVHLEGRPALVDDRGPFGNPTSDSARTCVDERTTALWMTVFAPAADGVDRMRAHVTVACELIAEHLVGDTPVETFGAVLPQEPVR